MKKLSFLSLFYYLIQAIKNIFLKKSNLRNKLYQNNGDEMSTFVQFLSDYMVYWKNTAESVTFQQRFLMDH